MIPCACCAPKLSRNHASDLVVERRHDGVVARAALVDPALRRECVEIANDLGLGGRVPGRLDPDVRAPGLIVLARPEEKPDQLAVAERDGARRVFLRPQRGDLCASRAGILEPLREQRLGRAVRTMPGRQQHSRGVELILCKRAQLEAAHPPTVTTSLGECEERDVTPGGAGAIFR